MFDNSQRLEVNYEYEVRGRETRRFYGNGVRQETFNDAIGRVVLIRILRCFMKHGFSFVFLFSFLLCSCFFELGGNLFLTNGYEHDVVLYALYNKNGTIIPESLKFFTAMGYIYDGRPPEYSYIIQLQLVSLDG